VYLLGRYEITDKELFSSDEIASIIWNLIVAAIVGVNHEKLEQELDEDILHYYPLAKTQQKRAKWPSCSRAETV
jgi:hypothetical protein